MHWKYMGLYLNSLILIRYISEILKPILNGKLKTDLKIEQILNWNPNIAIISKHELFYRNDKCGLNPPNCGHIPKPYNCWSVL